MVKNAGQMRINGWLIYSEIVLNDGGHDGGHDGLYGCRSKQLGMMNEVDYVSGLLKPSTGNEHDGWVVPLWTCQHWNYVGSRSGQMRQCENTPLQR